LLEKEQKEHLVSTDRFRGMEEFKTWHHTKNLKEHNYSVCIAIVWYQWSARNGCRLCHLPLTVRHAARKSALVLVWKIVIMWLYGR